MQAGADFQFIIDNDEDGSVVERLLFMIFSAWIITIPHGYFATMVILQHLIILARSPRGEGGCHLSWKHGQ